MARRGPLICAQRPCGKRLWRERPLGLRTVEPAKKKNRQHCGISPRPGKASASQPRRSAKTECVACFSRKRRWKDRLKEKACKTQQEQPCPPRPRALPTGSGRENAWPSNRLRCGEGSLDKTERPVAAYCRVLPSGHTAFRRCAPGCSLRLDGY